MIRNVGRIDRFIRLTIGMLLLGVLYTETVFIGSDEGVFLGAVAAVMLFTGLISWCPLYRLFGINSCKVSG